MQKINIINSNEIAKDVSSLVDHISSLSAKDKEWFSRIYFREVIKSKHYVVQSQDESATHVKYVGAQELLDNARYIVDWLSDLQERAPKQHAKLPRVTFQQALKHSQKWHSELAKQAEKSDRYIEPDSENAPKVLDMGEGWEAFWLKTKTARDIEGDVMGHCVGSGAYDGLNEGEAIFSIRKNNVAHITLHMEKLGIKQAVTKGNGEVPERYKYFMDKAAVMLGSKLFIGHSLEDTSSIPDGWCKNSEGAQIHIKNDLVNSDGDEPAVIKKNGTQEWWVDGKKNRNDGPAVILFDGTQIWYSEDKIHRLDGPAIIRKDGSKFWYKNDNSHKIDGPAIVLADGNQEWWVDGKRHREDGPAVIWADGTQMWFYDNKPHRLDGPAVIKLDGSQFWYKNDNRHRIDGPAVIRADNTQEWYEEGKRHRDDGPAVIYPDSGQEWWVNGKRHRDDGPAIIEADGTQIWYMDGKIHREDGPAIICANGDQEWWINGKRHRDDGPAVIWGNGTEEWYKDGYIHREDGPAVISANGRQEWWINGSLHREGGPAINHASGRKEWWIDGEEYTEEKFNEITTNMISTSAKPQ